MLKINLDIVEQGQEFNLFIEKIIMLLHRALKRLLVAPLVNEACNYLLPRLTSSREKHSDAAKELSDKAVTSRTSKFRHDHLAFLIYQKPS